MFVLGESVGELVGGAYLLALPGVLMYCAPLVWALWCAGWTWKRRGGWGLAALVWGCLFPVVFGLLALLTVMAMQTQGATRREQVAMLAAVSVCSGITALLLWKTTDEVGPPCACAAGCVLVSVVWMVIAPTAKSEMILLTTLAGAWAVPVGASLVMWGRGVRRLRPRHCAACGYDLRMLKGEVCPECGNAAAIKQ